MKRREFLAGSSAAGALIGLGGIGLASCSNLERKHITLLHTNDVHSHIDPFPDSHSEFPTRGGVARRAALVEQIRRENSNTDRKSTRLNSSHVKISYAVFCLKKKKTTMQ